MARGWTRETNTCLVPVNNQETFSQLHIRSQLGIVRLSKVKGIKMIFQTPSIHHPDVVITPETLFLLDALFQKRRPVRCDDVGYLSAPAAIYFLTNLGLPCHGSDYKGPTAPVWSQVPEANTIRNFTEAQ